MRVRMSGTDILTFIVLCIKCVSHGISAYNEINYTNPIDIVGKRGYNPKQVKQRRRRQ